MIRALLFCGLLGFQGNVSAQQYVISTVTGGGTPITPAAANTASIGDPPRVAVDAAGNVYYASLHALFKVDPSGTLTRIAGTGRYGMSGDGAAAINAQFEYPAGVALDSAGNIYVTDRDADVIRKIAVNGTISTFAGTGSIGYSGDGGQAAKAKFGGLAGLAFDSAGNLYVADTGNNCIRKITPEGVISTFAGTTVLGAGGDGGPATKADLNGPEGVAVDSAGNVYIADTFNHRVRKVAVDGTITAFAGTGFPSYAGDNGPAATANLFLPTDVAVDRTGAVYIADLGSSRVRQVTNDIIRTVAGTTAGVLAADGELAVSVRLSGPTGLAVDPTGVFYFAEGSIGSGSGLDAGDYKIWKVDINGIITGLAGTGQKNFSGDGGPATPAQVNVPTGVALDPAGNLYIADSANNRIRKIAADGTITTIAGYGPSGFSGDYGDATSALLNNPLGVAVDDSGNVFIADTGNNRVRIVNTEGMIYTVAGNGNAGFFGDGGLAIKASLHAPRAVAVDNIYNIYIADTLDNRIRKVGTDGIIDTFASRGQGFGGDGGPAVNALLNFPTGVALDQAGNLYVADQNNARVRKISTDGTINTVAGTDNAPGLGDGGPATSAMLNSPEGVAVDRAGNFYVSDSVQNRVRKVTADGKITTIGGNGQCCYGTDGGSSIDSPLNRPWGMAANASGSLLYVADVGNDAIRKIQAVPTGAQGAVTSAASNLTGPIAPGELVTIYGLGVGPVQPVQPAPGTTQLGIQLGGVSVLFNGVYGPIVYASSTQVTAVVPYGITGQTAQVVATNGSLITVSTSVPLAASAPALFTASATGSGQAVATNQDGSINSAARRATAGSLITLFATGEGQTSPGGIDGKVPSSPTASPVLPVSVTIGGQTAVVQAASQAPGSIGVMQVSVVVPSGVTAGSAVPVLLQVGSATSPSGVTLAIGN